MFLAAWRLWFLLGVLALAVIYLMVQARRKSYAIRFASAEMFDSISPRRPGFRRHIPAVILLLALSSLVVGFAKPTKTVLQPRERATVVVAIDVSLSMMADDVDPTRIDAAKVAASRFVDQLPPTLNVGIVSFAGAAAVRVPPTVNRPAAQTAIDNMELAEATAIGEAIFTSIDSLVNAPQQSPDEDGELPPAVIVLLSDGQTTVGREDAEAIEAAIAEDIPVSTIAFGTKDGYIEYDDPRTEAVEQDFIEVPVARDNLRVIADETGGAFFAASSLEELDSVYEDIGSSIGFEEVQAEISDWFIGAALALLAVSAALSLMWFQRLP